MSKAKFTYDESGATFFYFVLSFLALILVPSTYYLWPNESNENDKSKSSQCNCGGCINKRRSLADHHKWKRSRHRFVKAIIVIGWIAFITLAYKCATTKHEYVNWDPFEILGIREDSSADDIKKAYRKLSLIYHPDKETGDADRFVKITKAYAALTDEESRKNWELYGNPDGPGATSFGIALPSWIVEKENSFIVLGIYALVFMVALPVSVGLWWYKSVKFGCDKVLINTSELYYYFIHKTPNMALKRVIMILASSLEFAKSHNPEVVERPTDNIDVPRLIRDLPMLGEKNKERPLCFSYSIKTRAIIHAHLSRMKLTTNLETDRCFIVQKCPYLIQEFVQCVAQLITLALSGRIQNMPTLVTLENAMKLCPMVVQALWEYQNPLLQLPHFTDDILKALEKRKVRINSIERLARMTDTERRESLRIFTDAQYEDIQRVLATMPSLQVESRFEVLDDEDPGVITAGSIVTVNVKLRRKTMMDFLPSNISDSSTDKQPEELEGNDVENIKIEDTNYASKSEKGFNPNHRVQRRGKSKNKNKNNNNSKNNTTNNNNNINNNINISNDNSKTEIDDKQSSKVDDVDTVNDDSENDDEWDRKFQEKVLKKQKVFESKSKKSHSVHCPFYPDDKQEFWWIYIVDRKRFALVTAPLLVTSLVETEELELKFTAPHRPGSYSYTLVVRSDSYINHTVQKTNTIEVKQAKDYIEPVFDIEEDETEIGVEEEDSAVEDSDLMTDDDN